jgi:hypothetical protein
VTNSLDDVRSTKGRYWDPVALWTFLFRCSLQKDRSKDVQMEQNVTRRIVCAGFVLCIVTPHSLVDGYVDNLTHDCTLSQPSIPQSEKLPWNLERMLCSL